MLQHNHDVLAVAFRPDGKLLASATLDGQIYLWNPQDAVIEVLSRRLAAARSCNQLPGEHESKPAALCRAPLRAAETWLAAAEQRTGGQQATAPLGSASRRWRSVPTAPGYSLVSQARQPPAHAGRILWLDTACGTSIVCPSCANAKMVVG